MIWPDHIGKGNVVFCVGTPLEITQTSKLVLWTPATTVCCNTIKLAEIPHSVMDLITAHLN